MTAPNPPDPELAGSVVVQLQLGRPLDSNLEPNQATLWVQLDIYRSDGNTPLAPEQYQNEVIGPVFKALNPLGMESEWIGVATLQVQDTRHHHRKIRRDQIERMKSRLIDELENAGYQATAS